MVMCVALKCSSADSTAIVTLTYLVSAQQGKEWLPMPNAPRILLDGPYAAPAQRWDVRLSFKTLAYPRGSRIAAMLPLYKLYTSLGPSPLGRPAIDVCHDVPQQAHSVPQAPP